MDAPSTLRWFNVVMIAGMIAGNMRPTLLCCARLVRRCVRRTSGTRPTSWGNASNGFNDAPHEWHAIEKLSLAKLYISSHRISRHAWRVSKVCLWSISTTSKIAGRAKKGRREAMTVISTASPHIAATTPCTGVQATRARRLWLNSWSLIRSHLVAQASCNPSYSSSHSITKC
jgi:hypothetical protein